MGLNTERIQNVEATMEGKEKSYNYCRICGRQPQTELDEPNWSPLRYWDADDGWMIGTLCRWCWEDVKDDRPKPGDFAYDTTNGVCDDEFTENDPLLAFDDQPREGILAAYVSKKKLGADEG
jgi:hypothetical protein